MRKGLNKQGGGGGREKKRRKVGKSSSLAPHKGGQNGEQGKGRERKKELILDVWEEGKKTDVSRRTHGTGWSSGRTEGGNVKDRVQRRGKRLSCLRTESVGENTGKGQRLKANCKTKGKSGNSRRFRKGRGYFLGRLGFAVTERKRGGTRQPK